MILQVEGGHMGKFHPHGAWLFHLGKLSLLNPQNGGLVQMIFLGQLAVFLGSSY